MHNCALKTPLYSNFALPWRCDIMEYSSIDSSDDAASRAIIGSRHSSYYMPDTFSSIFYICSKAPCWSTAFSSVCKETNSQVIRFSKTDQCQSHIPYDRAIRRHICCIKTTEIQACAILRKSEFPLIYKWV